MKAEAILKTSNLSIGYLKAGSKNIVAADVNLQIKRGLLTCIIGANGVGKSTLLRTISGLQEKLSGEVLIEGEEISKIKSARLATKLSLVLTDKIPPGNMSVRELISVGRQPYTNWLGKLKPDDIAKIDEAIGLTGIGHLSNKKFHEISDGQLQTVMIARALAQDTPVILLDEPSTHLDLLHKVSLFRLLRDLAHQHQKTILFSTHDIELALQASDEVIMMNEKNVIQEDIASFLKNRSFERIFEGSGVSFDTEKMTFNFEGFR